MSVAANYKFATSHEWISIEEDGVVTMGISDHAQEALGDLVFVELPDVGASFSKGEEFGVVESVKAASDIYAPVSGEVVEVNAELEDAPELLNNEPYTDGWIVKLRLTDPSELEELLSEADYLASLED